MTKYIFSLTILVMPAFIFAQLLNEIPSIGEFKPEIEQVESPLHGIQLYDQYCAMNKEPKIRKKPGGSIVNGSHKDVYDNGRDLHKGVYKEGVIQSFTNYFLNGQIERKYKFKAAGKGDLLVYYGSGNKRLHKKIYNYTPVEIEVYNEDEVLVKSEKYDKTTLEPTEIKIFHDNGKMKSLMKSKNAKEKTYAYTTYSDIGKIITQGEMTYNKESSIIEKSGNWITFNEDNQIIMDVEYESGLVAKVNKGEDLIEVDNTLAVTSTPTDTEVTSDTANNNTSDNNGNETSKSVSDTGSSLDPIVARFDKDGNNDITVKELHGAINDFFDDETIELSQIDFLINFFFDQD